MTQSRHLQRLLLVAAAVEMALGLTMHFIPGPYAAPAYQSAHPYSGSFSHLLMAGGVILMLMGRRRLSLWQQRALALVPASPLAGLAVLKAGPFWSAPILYGVLAVAVLIAPWVATPVHAERQVVGSRPGNSETPAAVERTLETWLWLFVVLLLVISALVGDDALVPADMLVGFLLVVSVYNVLALVAFPHAGSAHRRLAAHLGFVTLSIGYLMSGGLAMSHVLLITLVLAPLLGARLLGSGAGLRLLVLAVAAGVAGHLRLWATGELNLVELLEHTVADSMLLVFTYQVLSWDVAARRAVERALQAAEDRFSRFFEASPIATAITTVAGGRYMHVNPALCELIGYARSEVEGRTSLELGLLDPGERRALVDSVYQAGAARNKEIALRNRSGQSRNLLLNAELIRLEGEDCILGLYQDITAQRRTEAELARRAREHAAVAELGQLALGGGDLDGLMQAVVSRCASVLAMDYCKVLQLESTGREFVLRAGAGWHPGLVGTAKVGTGLDSQAGYALISRQPVVVTDLRREQRFSGSPLLRDHAVTCGISTIIGEFDRPWGVLGVHSARPITFTGDDVNFVQSLANVIALATTRKAAEDRLAALNAELEQRVARRTRELTAANKELESFAYSVSHDLRAPLRSIDGFSKLALDRFGHQVDEQLADFLQRVRLASQSMGRLIDDLLALSRVTRWELRPQPVNLSALASSILMEFQRTSPGRNVQWATQANVQGKGDRRLLEIAVRNLLDNAWKFTSPREPARIEFGSRRQDAETVYYVRDNGVGFDMAHAAKLFGPFERLHRENEFPGTGVGLATVQRIIDRHGGRIWADAAVGQGATFFFTLPESPEEGHDYAPHPAGGRP